MVAICLPGILVVVPGAIRSMEKNLASAPIEAQKKPSRVLLTFAGVLQSTIIVSITAALGTAFAHRVGLEAPFFQAIVSREGVLEAFMGQLIPGLIGGVWGTAVFLGAYYFIFRPRLDTKTVDCMEGLRLEMGIWGRVLYGGIAEEVIARWGCMSFLVWLGSLTVGKTSGIIVWLAIIVSGVVFALGHVPSYVNAGCKSSKLFTLLMLTLNLWVSLVFGWLFWHYGLFSAIVAHMLVHILWFPFDLHYAKKRQTR